MDAGKCAALDRKRCTAISVYGINTGIHHGKGRDDTLHRPFLDGSISGQYAVKRLTGENAGKKAYGRAAVSGIEHSIRSGKTVQPLSVNFYGGTVLFNFDSHFPEAGDRGKAVCTGQKIFCFRFSVGECAEHDTSVRDGFIARYAEFAAQGSFFFNDHNKIPSGLCYLQFYRIHT